MSGNSTYPTNWSADDIHRYLDGGMATEELNRFETDLKNDPFLKDAVDGYAGHARLYVDHHLQRLEKQFNSSSSSQSRKIPVWMIGVAASALILAVAWFSIGDILVDGISAKMADRKAQKELLADNDDSDKKSNPKVLKDEYSGAPIAAKSEAELNDSMKFMGEESLVSEDLVANSNSIPSPRKTRRRKKTTPTSNGIISGVVLNDAGDPLIGASVYFPTNEAAITTDFDGKFAVQLKDYDSVAIVNYTGFQSGVFPLGLSEKHQFNLKFDESDVVNVEVTGLEKPEIAATAMDEAMEEKKKQIAASASDNLDEALSIAEIEASPEKGFRKYEKYIKRNIVYPAAASQAGVEGVVKVQFKVLPNGELFDVRVIQGLGSGCDEEAVRLIKEGPSWAADDQTQVRQATYSIEFKK